MIYTSLAVLALSASASLTPFSKFMHPHSAPADRRVTVTLHNQNNLFQDVKVLGRSYTIPAERGITIKAPAGTIVYADGPNGLHPRGEALLQMTSATNQHTINL